MDIFATPVPRFNIEGATKISSSVGLTFTALSFMIILGISVSKIVILFHGGDPVISSYKINNMYRLDERENLDNFDFQIAFKVDAKGV